MRKINISFIFVALFVAFNLNAADDNRRTMENFLFTNIRSKNYQAVKKLIEGEVSVNCMFMQGGRPLTVAVAWGNSDMVKFLLEHGANINIKDDTGNTPLMIAVFRDSPELIQILLNAGADVNIVNGAGETFIDHINKTGKEISLEAYKDFLKEREEFKKKIAELIADSKFLIPDLVNIVSTYI